MPAMTFQNQRKTQGKGRPGITLDMKPNGCAQSAPPGMRTDHLRDVCVLSHNDWNRIQLQLRKRQIEEDKRRQVADDKQRHQRLMADTKNWANTIAGQRQKKLEGRKIREAEEEEERKRIDLEEAKYQAEKRREALQQARTLQYYQTDRVKGFHSALILSEVLKERDAQIEMKRLRQVASAGQDMEWAERERREIEEANRLERERALQRLREHHETANFQLDQVRRHHDQMVQEKREGQLEAEELERLKEQQLIERQRMEEIKKKEARQLMESNLKQIEDVKRVRLMQQHQEEEEDDECRVFAAAKRKMMKLRAEKEKQLHNEKQEQLERIRSKLHAQNMQKIDDEDERIRRALEEADTKREQEEKEREEKNKQAFEEMARHRHEMMRQLEFQKQEEKRREAEMLAMKQAVDEEFLRNEAEKRRRKLEETKELANYQLHQIDHRHASEKAHDMEQLTRDAYNMNLVDLEEQHFQEYANKVINHSKEGGRNVYPLQKAARAGAGGGLGPLFAAKGSIRPSYMTSDYAGVELPAYKREATEEIKQTINGDGNTDKRLGFVW